VFDPEGVVTTDPYPARRTGKVRVTKPSWPVRVTLVGVEVLTYVGELAVTLGTPGVEARAEVGELSASVGVGIALRGVAVAADLGVVDSEAVQNPTVEELGLLFLLPCVGGET